MKLDDVETFATAYRAGLMPLRAVAAALVMYRRQRGREADVAELMDRTGAGRSTAYRALAAAVAMPANPPAEEGKESTNRRQIESTNQGQRVRGSRTDSPKIVDTESEDRRPLPLRERGIQEREREQASNAGGRETTPEPSTYPNGPSPESERRPVVEMVDRQTAGSLGYWAQAACREYPARWVDLLARRKILGAREQPRVQLLNAILQRWAAAGACEFETAMPATVPMMAAAGEAAPRLPSPPERLTFRQMDRRDREAEDRRIRIECEVRDKYGLDAGPLTDAARAELEARLCIA